MLQAYKDFQIQRDYLIELKSFGVTYYLAEDILKLSDLNIKPILERNDYIHLTICTDVFHITCAPGVSAPQTFGIWPNQAIGLLNTIAKTKKEFDIRSC